MAANLNKVFLMGNLTRDPEVRYTPKGTAVGEFGLAINDSYKAQDGTIKESVTYVDIEVWSRQAETCKQYLSKGRPVFIEGSLKFDQWESPEGQKKSKLRVRAERVQFLGSPGGAQGGGGSGRSTYAGGGGPPGEQAAKPSRPATPPGGDDHPPVPDEDDIPF